MQRSLKFISISSQNTNLEIRQGYSLQDQEIEVLMERITSEFSDINGLLLLSTCNRTEVYFESTTTKVKTILKALEEFLEITPSTTAKNPENGYLTEQSLKHLSEVACGLKSTILGDKEIMGQIKKAYKRSLKNNLQGSLLERVMQQVIRIHKRVHNETSLKKGSTSAAYRSLKCLEQHFGKSNLQNKKILLIGAGQIIEEVLAYSEKCSLGEIYITNRTFEKAKNLENRYLLTPLPFEIVFKKEELSKYDAIISAVSGKKHFITSNSISNATEKNRMIIDLAVPANVHPKVSEHAKLVNIDQLSEDIQQTKHQQIEAIEEVEQIINIENLAFNSWLKAYFKRKADSVGVSLEMSIS